MSLCPFLLILFDSDYLVFDFLFTLSVTQKFSYILERRCKSSFISSLGPPLNYKHYEISLVVRVLFYQTI